jgi:hypothetical protein
MRFPAAPIGMALALFVPALASAQNTPPVADAGEDQTIYLGSSVSLHGTATDADGDAIAGWIWEIESSPADSTPLLGAEFSANASFLADVAGDYALSLVAFDGTDWSLPDSVAITYVQNQPPIAIATAAPQTGPAPLTVEHDGTQSWDPEGAFLIHAWEFGDGTAPTLDPAPAHTYQNPGTFFAQLWRWKTTSASSISTPSRSPSPSHRWCPPSSRPASWCSRCC